MKKFVKYFSILLASASFAACQTTELENVEETVIGAQEFEVFANIPETKTVNDGMSTKWAEGDTISIFHAEAGTADYVNDGKFTVADPQTGRFTGTISETLSALSYDWYSIYPYTYSISTPGERDKGYVYIGCRSDQYQTQDGNDSMDHICGKNVPMYGVVRGQDSKVAPKLVQHQLASVVQVHVTNNTTSDLTVNTVRFTGTEEIVGAFMVDITGESVAYPIYSTYASKEATLSVTNASAISASETADFYIVIKPFTAPSGEELKVSVNGYERTISLEKDVLFAAGKIKTINFNYDNEVAPATGKYVKVTSTSDLADGKYLIVYETKNVALNGALTSDVASNTVSVTISNGEIASTIAIDAAAVTYSAADGSFLGGGGKYIGHSGSGNTLNYSNSALANVVTFDNGNAVITAGDYVMRYNATSGQDRFRYYKSGQQAIQLYKYTASTTPTPAPTLTSIEVKTAPTKVAYTAGETFDPTGLVITKHMSDETTEDVAYADHESEFSFSPSLSTALATSDVKVSITYGGKSVDQAIEVTQNGSSQDGELKTWTYEVSTSSPVLKEGTPATVNEATWSIVMGTKNGSPTANGAPTNSYSKCGWKWGNSSSNYWSSYTLSTDYFASKKVKIVTVNILNNGSKAGTMTVMQGSTTIGTTTATFGSVWTDLTANTTQGTSGTLTIEYTVAQASYIHSITVEYYD